MTPKARDRTGHRNCLLALTAWMALASCDRRDPAVTPANPAVVLDVDGMEITREEIAAFDDYFDELDSTMGRKYRTRELLDRYLVPLAIARRELAAERAELLKAAEALAAVAQNHAELSTKGALSGGLAPEDGFSRNQVPFPVAAWVFDPERLLQTSPPIETPRGFIVAAARDIRPGLTRVSDRSLAFLVPFRTHDPVEFDSWLADRKRDLRGRVRYVAPELEDALPPWLMP